MLNEPEDLSIFRESHCIITNVSLSFAIIALISFGINLLRDFVIMRLGRAVVGKILLYLDTLKRSMYDLGYVGMVALD